MACGQSCLGEGEGPQDGAATLMGSICLVCRGMWAGGITCPLQCPVGVHSGATLAGLLRRQLLPAEVRTWWLGLGGVGKEGADEFLGVPGHSNGSELPLRL